MPVFIVREYAEPLAAFVSQTEAVAYAQRIANEVPATPRVSSATRHLLVETWDGPACDWHDTIHVYAQH